MTITVVVVISIVCVVALLFWLNQKKYKNATYLSHLDYASKFLTAIESLDDYVTWVERDKIRSAYSNAGFFFKNKTWFYRKEKTVKRFNDVFKNFDEFIEQYNENYVKTQKNRLTDYFDNIEEKKLDDQQRTAIITDEYSNLIIAGAGSGKTLTILGKVQYLIEHKNVNPKDILLISFTKKTVDELNERLSKLKIATKATTFHKLGYNIIRKHHQDIPSVTNENTIRQVIGNYLQSDIFNHPKALQAYIEYVACYMNIPEEYENFSSFGEKLDVEKGINFQTLKSKCQPLNIVSTSNLDTIQGEKVKSVEELIIANFLYLNGIEYEYEKAYPYGSINYHPDFFLSEYNIYLEHFGVDEDNKAPWLSPFNEQKYVEEMKLKRQNHINYNTKLLETYSYYNKNKVLLIKLKEMLEAENVIFQPRDPKSIFSKVIENEKVFGNELIKLIESFINLSKSRRLTANSLKRLFAEKNKNNFMQERQELFLEFVLPIIEKYKDYLALNNEIDFNDMINRATDLLKNKEPHNSYRYIIIDEYQDISFSRFNLIKEIRNKSGAKLVCVGDDWQSIYRFAGSDISLFSNFEKYVGKYEQLLIEQTYRNSQSLTDIASKYIQKNPKQISKTPKSKKEFLEDPIKFVYYKNEEIESRFINELRKLISEYGIQSILVLGRHSFDINDLIKLTQSNRIKYIERTGKLEIKGFENTDIKYLTIHKSKGTEADNVIVLNLKNHLLGFPNKITDDPILSLLLSDHENYRFAEERRLFYVALTRTKNKVILFVPSETSIFVDELLKDNDHYILTNYKGKFSHTHCPYCKTGKLIIRQNTSNGNRFLGCSHYPHCDQTFRDIEILENQFLCPDCKSGFMIKRSGKHGKFLGCSNYPKCRYTVNF